jgi:dihydroorotase
MEPHSVKKDMPASISLFRPDEKWTVGRFQSRSKNSPFLGKQLTGKPFGIINKDKVFLND